MPQQRLFVSDSFAVLQDAFVTAVRALKGADPLAPLVVLAPARARSEGEVVAAEGPKVQRAAHLAHGAARPLAR
jgi:hypothetical protein